MNYGEGKILANQAGVQAKINPTEDGELMGKKQTKVTPEKCDVNQPRINYAEKNFF